MFVSATLQEVGMFPIAALLEVGNVNLSRVELIWSPITTHLSEVRGRGRETQRERGREREIFLPTGLLSRVSLIESFCC